MYSSGKHALGICDKCGMTCKYRNLHNEITAYSNDQQVASYTNLRVCRDCRDNPSPLKKIMVDSEALRNPRPDRIEPTIVDNPEVNDMPSSL